MRTVKIGRRLVGEGRPCFIIAEAGSNHDGRLDRAYALVDAAAAAGADAVKFQVFRAATLYPKDESRPEYLKKLGVTKTIYRTIADMEMPFSWIAKLAARCRRRGILFMATPFDEECVDRLDPYMPAHKIASYELTHAPLIEHARRKRKPVILSTGGADLAEIGRAVKGLRGSPLCLMQCTAKYPAPPASMNLKTIPAMRERFGVPVGLSDHSLDPVAAPVAAVALGAAILEKHFTMSRRLKGPDHSYAIEPDELKTMVAAVRAAEAMLGDGKKRPHPVEGELRDYRRGVFTTAPVAAGARLTRGNVGVLRRAGRKETNLPPAALPAVLRGRARRNLPAFRLLSRSDVSF